MSGTRKALAALGVVGVLGAGAVLPALAQDSTDAPDTAGSQARGEWKAQRHAVFAEALAAELELPVEQVTEALAAVRDRMVGEARARQLERLGERLDAAVEEGELTREQADAILEAAEDGVLPVGGRRHRPRGHGFGHLGPGPAVAG